MRRKHSLRATLLTALLISLAQVWVFSGFIVIKPGIADPVGSLVRVAGGYPSEGNLLFTAVKAQRSNAFEVLRAIVDPNIELRSFRGDIPRGVSWGEYSEFMLQLMKDSQEVAAVIALRQLGVRVEIHGEVRVARILESSPAQGRLMAGDVLVAVDGVPVVRAAEAVQEIRDRSIGEPVRLTIRRDGRQVSTFELNTVPAGRDSTRPGLNIFVASEQRVTFPRDISFDDREIGGSSAGLMLALEVYDQMTPYPLVEGLTVAGTGALRLDGTVEAVDGVRQKVIASERGGASVFLAPRANAAEARKVAKRLRVVPVDTFDQVIRVLQHLGREE